MGNPFKSPKSNSPQEPKPVAPVPTAKKAVAKSTQRDISRRKGRAAQGLRQFTSFFDI